MPLIATLPALMATSAAVTGGASAVSGYMGSRAAKNAAKTQANASVEAARMNTDAANRATDLQRDQFNRQQDNLAPWLEAGKQGLSKLSDFLNQDNDFNETFDPSKVQFDPGFERRMEAGNRILTSGFAAKGDLGNGRAAEALVKANQDMTSDEYGAAYGRAFGEYRNKMDVFNTNKANKFNRLAALTGIGQQATSQLDQAGSEYANNAGNILTGNAQRNAQATQEGAAATAAGQVGSSNSWSNALKNIVDNVNGMLTLKMIPALGGKFSTGMQPFSTRNFGAPSPAYAEG